MKRLLITLLLVAAVLSLVGCARASQVSLQDVVDGTATAENYVRATVTDTREADQLLVELSHEEATVWTTGFEERPGRGSEVWTAFVGPPVEHDLVGLAYPTAGVLETPEEGLTETGSLAVVLGILAVVAVLVPALTAGLGRLRSGQRCRHCGASAEPGWITCADCGRSLAPEKTGGPPTPATVFTAQNQPAVAVPDAPHDTEEDEPSEPPAGGTRIVHRDQ